MVDVRFCRCCGEIVHLGEPCIFVKRGRWIFYYHEKCVKGEHKNDSVRKGH